MAGRILPIPVRRRKPACIAVLAILTLCLRLILPAPMPAVANAAPLDLVAAFGEHALCIAGTAAERDATPRDVPAPQHGDHTDHECPGCCTSAAQDAGVLPRTLGIRIHFAPPSPIVALVEEPASPNPHRIRPAEPRGPPTLG